VNARSSARSRPDLTSLLHLAAASLAVLYALMYVGVALARMGHPFELEWMEGGCLDHVRRVLAGQPLYVAPSVEFVPYIYTPLYFYVTALVSIPLHGGFLPGRLVSFLASLGVLALIYHLVRRGTSGRLPALLAAGLFVAAYRRGGAWLDIVRVDSLFLLFALAAIAVLAREPRTRTAAFAAGVLFSLAFFTKQIALGITLPILLGMLIVDRRRLLPFAAALLLGIGGGSLIMERLTDGWFGFYVFTLPGRHKLLGGPLLDFWTFDLLGPFTIALALAAYFFAARAAARGFRSVILDLSNAAGLIWASWVARLHDGGYANVLLPAFAAIAIHFGLGLGTLLEHWHERSTPARVFAERFVMALVVVQFLIPVYNPFGQLPRRSDIAAGRALIERIRQTPGDVWLTGQGYLAERAGKPSFAQAQAISDVVRAGDSRGERAWTASLDRAIDQRRFAMVILEDRHGYGTPALEPSLARGYRPIGPVFTPEQDRAFWPVTGTPIRPGTMWVPDSVKTLAAR
jgi:hypothetical protein